MKNMDKKDVAGFFDDLAPNWDEQMILKEPLVNRILDNAHISQGQTILDVACGTGILFPFYLERQVSKITGIDISPKMAQLASEKYADNSLIQVICGDAETMKYDQKYDRIMIYNAFPHFPDPAGLIEKLSCQLNDGGRLTVAHSMSRDRVNMHHMGVKEVALPLPDAKTLAELFSSRFDVDVVISDDAIYEVSGIVK